MPLSGNFSRLIRLVASTNSPFQPVGTLEVGLMERKVDGFDDENTEQCMKHDPRTRIDYILVAPTDADLRLERLRKSSSLPRFFARATKHASA